MHTDKLAAELNALNHTYIAPARPVDARTAAVRDARVAADRARAAARWARECANDGR